jgi:hypothetical protein
MDTTPYPHLDEFIWRLRERPEVEAILHADGTKAPQPSEPVTLTASIPDEQLAAQLKASIADFHARIDQVAVDVPSFQHAFAVIQSKLTLNDITTIMAECTGIQATAAWFAQYYDAEWDLQLRRNGRGHMEKAWRRHGESIETAHIR